MSTGASNYDPKYTSFNPDARADGTPSRTPSQPRSREDEKLPKNKKEPKRDSKRDKTPPVADKDKGSCVERMPFQSI